MTELKLDSRETDTIIAALRAWQWKKFPKTFTRQPTGADFDEIASEHGPALNDKELDTLISQINQDEDCPVCGKEPCGCIRLHDAIV